MRAKKKKNGKKMIFTVGTTGVKVVKSKRDTVKSLEIFEKSRVVPKQEQLVLDEGDDDDVDFDIQSIQSFMIPDEYGTELLNEPLYSVPGTVTSVPLSELGFDDLDFTETNVDVLTKETNAKQRFLQERSIELIQRQSDLQKRQEVLESRKRGLLLSSAIVKENKGRIPFLLDKVKNQLVFVKSRVVQFDQNEKMFKEKCTALFPVYQRLLKFQKRVKNCFV